MKVILSKALAAQIYDGYVIAFRSGKRVVYVASTPKPNGYHAGVSGIDAHDVFHSYDAAEKYVERHHKTLNLNGDAFQIVGVLIETNGSVDTVTVPNNQVKTSAWIKFED